MDNLSSELVNEIPVKDQNEGWQKQMRELEEIDEWLKILNERILEVDQKEAFNRYIVKFAGLQSIHIYRMMNNLGWEAHNLKLFYDLLIKTPFVVVLDLISIMESFTEHKLLNTFLNVFCLFEASKITESVTKTIRSDIHLLIQVARHLSDSEIENMGEIINNLSVQELIDMLKKCNEPFAKLCRLCRTKKLKSLETRLIHNQIPDYIPKMTSTISLYDQAEVWQADDEQGFTFDSYEGKIYYYYEVVDLVQICDNCLQDTHKAVTNFGRYYIKRYNIKMNTFSYYIN